MRRKRNWPLCNLSEFLMGGGGNKLPQPLGFHHLHNGLSARAKRSTANWTPLSFAEWRLVEIIFEQESSNSNKNVFVQNLERGNLSSSIQKYWDISWMMDIYTRAHTTIDVFRRIMLTCHANNVIAKDVISTARVVDEEWTASSMITYDSLYEATRNRGASQSKNHFWDRRTDYRVGLPQTRQNARDVRPSV